MDLYWQKVEEAISRAAEMPKSEYQVWLTEFCAGNQELKSEIKSFLSLEIEAEKFLEKSIGSYTAKIFGDNETSFSDKHFGNYKIIREIGRGGMGAVFLAERDDGEFSQQVALKIVRQTLIDKELEKQFKKERQILANLNHPNIAKLLDGGVSENDEPFIAMEYIEGETLTEYADRKNLDVQNRLNLFLKICQAVSFAHRNLIVHRDIKPSNILVTTGGEPKLLDFGLAKVLDESLNENQTQTVFRALTPAYASPEQLKGETITTVSDIYSLGIVLYELLTNERPFHFEGKSLEQIVKDVTDFNPPPPSANPKSQIPNLKLLKGDIDNIILTALRKEPERRYQSVENFAADIERHLQGLPISARPNTFRYRTEKFIQRNKAAVIAGFLILTALFAGLITTFWQARVAARERDQAQQAQAKAEQLNVFLQNILSSASPEEKGKDAKVIEVLNDAAQNIDAKFAGQPELKAQALLTIGQTFLQLGLSIEADKILRQALSLNSELHGEQSRETAASQIYLGATVLDEAKFDEAEELLDKAVATEQKFSPAESRDLALALNVLGELYVRKRNLEKAKSLLQESAAMFDNLSGENNPDSALALVSLGRAQMFSGDSVAAENSFRKSVEIYRQLPARYESRKGMALINYGLLLVSKGSYDEGIALMREADEIFVRRQGESFYTFESAFYLCNAYFAKHDYPQTIIHAQKAVESGRRLKDEDTPDFWSALQNLGLALTRSGKAKEGEPFLQEFLERAKKTSTGAFDFAKGALGECLTAQKRFVEAEPLLKESYENLKSSLGENNLQTQSAKNRLDEFYKISGRK